MWIDVALDHFSARNQQPGLWIAVDVLRATSVMTTFLAEGGNTIYLTGDVEEARALRRQFNLLAMGEQGALPIPGFDFDNSPLALLKAKDRIQGRSVVHTTSNGTKLVKLLMSLGGVVLAGSFLNLSACVSKAAELLSNGGLPAPDPARAARGNISDGRKLADSGTGIVVACAGRRGMPILDDTYFAGAFVKRLRALLPDAEVGDGALIAQAVTEALPVDVAFRESESGLVMAELGLQEEISFCARVDVYSCVPQASIEGGHLVMKS
jgi:2-phosphosulfolactate phosphatase